MKDVETSDKIAMLVLAVMFIAVGGWWFGKVIPERDAKLFAIHECYTDMGCSSLGVPGQDQAASECWASCTVEAAKEHHRSEGFASATERNR